MPNIYLKGTKIYSKGSFWEAPTHADTTEF